MAESIFTDINVDRIRTIHHENFFDYLSSAYEVLRKIFSYLSLDDLETVSKAFEKWKPIVEITKNERTVIDSFVFTYKFEDCKFRSEANFCITFCIEEHKTLDDKLRKHLKENSEFITIESKAGVIGTPNDFSQIVQQKMFTYSSPTVKSALATHIRLPSFPDVGVKTFVWYKHMSFNDFRNNFILPDNKIIKCLLILMTFQETERKACKQKDDFISFLEKTQSESFAVGGCLIDSFPNDFDAVTKYIIFYGDKVETASIVLKQDVQTKEKIISKIEELKSICPKTERGVVFVFRCCSRNKISRQPKVRRNLCMWERDALMKYFPSIPIVGCYGYGEFGKKFPENKNSKSSCKKSRQSDIWEYSFSTSIVYIGFKK